MLKITIPKRKLWDSENELFINTKEHTLTLEHSLISISKWEAKWKVPFIGDDKKTKEQTISYIKYMTLTQNVDDSVYEMLTQKNLKSISEYIDDSMTATWFSEPKLSGSGKPKKPLKKEVITSELVYYWMVALEIPFECQKWHFNRLMTLVKVCNAKAKAADAKNNKGKKKPKQNFAELNAARRKALGTSG